MLVLTRKCDESIRIGNNIIVKVLESSSGHVKLGIEAPRKIPVHREEIYQRIQEENKASLVPEDFTPDILKNILKKG
ncbi:MAG: carbon storage regulator CsrA [Candidatus Marinimicrobia bacterium]|nr:carbon storage regulator CsrA [Candidatus Neomarinimicrobiota bacterium]